MRTNDLAELKCVLFAGELERAGDEDEHAAGGTGRLAIDSSDRVLALLERKRGELGDDVLGALDLLAFERKHGGILVQAAEACAVGIEHGVVVLDERFR